MWKYKYCRAGCSLRTPPHFPCCTASFYMNKYLITATRCVVERSSTERWFEMFRCDLISISITFSVCSSRVIFYEKSLPNFPFKFAHFHSLAHHVHLIPITRSLCHPRRPFALVTHIWRAQNSCKTLANTMQFTKYDTFALLALLSRFLHAECNSGRSLGHAFCENDSHKQVVFHQKCLDLFFLAFSTQQHKCSRNIWDFAFSWFHFRN